MTRHFPNSLRRAAALAMSLLMALAQLAAPAAALAETMVDVAQLPTVTLYYQISAEDEVPTPAPIFADTSTGTPIYWALLPEQAFQFPITIDVMGSGDPLYTYGPASGSAIAAVNAPAADGVSMSATIDVYQEGALTASYPLYLSTIPMPPPQTQNAQVEIAYVDVETQAVLLSYTQEYAPGQYTVTPDRAGELMDYALEGANAVDLTVNADGSYSPAPVTFAFKSNKQPEPPQNVAVQIVYQDVADGHELLSYTQEYAPGQYTVTPDRAGELMDYVLEGANAVDLTVNADGSYSPAPVTFAFKSGGEPEPPQQNWDVKIKYQSTDNVYSFEDTKSYLPGTHTITAERAGELNGYTLQEPSSYEVTVNADGSYSPAPIFTFVANEPAEPDPGPGEGGGESEGGGEEVPPAQTDINRYGMTNDVVNFRQETSTSAKKAFADVLKDKYVWVYASLNVDGAEWLSIRYNETDCFVMAKFINVLSQEDSDKVDNANKTPAQVEVSYVDDETNEVFYRETASCPVDSQTPVSVREDMSQGYTLQGDGVVTVTVDKDGNANPAEVVFHFIRTRVQASVYISYVDGEREFANETLTFEQGESPVSPNANLVPEGYTLQNASTQTVKVDASGAATPNAVTFTYAKPAVSAQVTFRYLNSADRTPVLEERVETLGQGAYATADYRLDAPSGYTFESVSHSEVVVDGGGNANPAVVEFLYAPIPVTGTVTFRYMNTNNEPVANERTEVLGAGTYSSSSFAITVPQGYTYQGVSTESFEITAQGTANPEVITFTYAPEAVVPKTAEVSLAYVDTKGNPVAAAAVRTLNPGTYSIGEFAIAVPEGYEYQGVNAEQVIVSQDGVATPASVTFTYAEVQKPAVTAEVTFTFQSTSGKALAEPLKVPMEEGEHGTAEYAAAVEGYTLQNASADSVTVTPDGRANPAAVTFTYIENQSTATVEVHYVNSFGEDLPGSPQKVELKAGTHEVAPDPAFVPAGYSLSSNSAKSHQITVSNNLVATPNSVSFTYYDSGMSATVEVIYVDSSTNKTFASEKLNLTPGTYNVTPNEAVVNGAGNYELNDASITSQEVFVNEQGAAYPTQVRFDYKPKKIDVYMGYAVTTTQTALRSAADNSDSSIKKTLPKDTLLYINGQYTSGSTVWDSAQTVLGGTESGWVLDSATRHISKEEADRIIKEYNQNNPTEPEQSSGYYITIGSNVPLRVVADPFAEAKYYLPIDTVVYVQGQQYKDKTGWHISTYQGYTGYIRADQLRKMTSSEVEAYLNSQKTTAPTNTNTAAPYDPYAKSSYGYVTSSTVNFRATPNGTKIKTLNKYAFALILGTKEVNGVTWYNVNQSGTIGWVHGSYFHNLNLTELSSFLNSKEYLQGLQNNSGSGSSGGGSSGGSGSGGSSSGGSSGSSSQGNISSVEDWNVGTWQNTGITSQTSYAPFNPYATPVASASVSPSGSVEPTSTFVIGTMIPINYEDESKETQTDSVPWGLIGAAVVLIGGAGGVYAYALNQNKKRKAAASRAAASRRAGVNNGANGQQAQSPYTRRAVAAPPVAGTKQNDGKTGGTGTASGGAAANGTGAAGATFGGVKNPYSSGSITGTGSVNPYQSPNTVSGGTTGLYGTGTPAAGSAFGTGTAGTDSSGSAGGASMTTPNPYAAGATQGKATDADGAGTGAMGSTTASTGTNPYARPLGTVGTQANPPAPESAENPRRSTRMQRYHAVEDGENNSDNT